MILGPFSVLTGHVPDLDARLPAKHSLRRAADEAKMAVAVAAEVLKGVPVSDRLGVYIGQHQGSLEFCAKFIDQSYKEGPRFASPAYFAESVANNTATHLSLTFGLKGVVQTFIGSRVAGIQAVMAAREDVEDGVVDAGLVVVISGPTLLTRDAYGAVYHPHRRRTSESFTMLRGAGACLVRREGAGPRLERAAVRSAGRGRAVDALRSLGVSGPVLGSWFCLSGLSSRLAFSAAGLDPMRLEEPGEAFALDPFLQLLAERRAGPRTVVTLSEEGTAGVLSLIG
ncbi:MAG TPA: hypothetical protein VF950_28250 [Planctomycetota bacterium]